MPGTFSNFCKFFSLDCILYDFVKQGQKKKPCFQNWPGENFFIIYPNALLHEYQNKYFFFKTKKSTQKQKAKEIKENRKKNKEEKEKENLMG